MSDSNATVVEQRSGAIDDSTVIRPFEYGHNEKIVDIDFSMKRVRVCLRCDGKLMKKPEYYDDDDFSTEQKKEIVERIGSHPAGPRETLCGAFAGDLMVGYLKMFVFPSEEDMWGIAHCFVSRKYRRQGIATRLSALAKRKAVDSGEGLSFFVCNKPVCRRLLSIGAICTLPEAP